MHLRRWTGSRPRSRDFGSCAVRHRVWRPCWRIWAVRLAAGSIVLVEGCHLADLLPGLVVGGGPGQVPATPAPSSAGASYGLPRLLGTGVVA